MRDVANRNFDTFFSTGKVVPDSCRYSWMLLKYSVIISSSIWLFTLSCISLTIYSSSLEACWKTDDIPDVRPVSLFNPEDDDPLAWLPLLKPNDGWKRF
jgi:hypothetical protein